MTETIGFIGFGLIGRGIAFLAVNAGYKVVISNSRGPDTLVQAVETLGGESVASADTTENIVDNPDIKILVLSVPLKVLPTLLPPLGSFKDKLIIDTSNYYSVRDGHIEELDSYEVTTSEWVVKQFKENPEELKIVKAFHNQDAVHLLMNATKNPEKQTILPIAGDNQEAKKAAEKVINKLGFAVFDAGSFKDSWRIEPRTPIYGTVYFPEPPAGYTGKQLQQYYLENLAPPLTKGKAKELIDKAEKVNPVGGQLTDIPPFWLELFHKLAHDNDASFTKELLKFNN